MLQTTKLMHTILCLLAVLIIEVTTLSERDKIIVNKNVITIVAKEKGISNSTEINHDSSTDSQQFCSYLQIGPLQCSQDRLLLYYEYCATFNEKTKLFSIFNCPYFQWDRYGYYQMQLPQNLSELNKFMCGPLNRKGFVCSECADGFGPSVTSYGYRCTNCTDALYGVPLFLFLEFAPITVFYIICLAFQISVTSAPMPCFIMYAQIIVVTFDFTTTNTPVLYKIIPRDNLDHRVDIKITLALYRVFNLDFGHYLLPPYCLSSKLKFIHEAYLGYISAFYPPLLILLTWICIELHGRNFRPLVWLWKPFHRCFVRLRRGWDTKSDIIDVFTTFLLLSCGKILYQTLLLLDRDEIININLSGHHFTSYQCVADQSVSYGSSYHLLFAIPSVLIFCVCTIVPLLLLILYPIRAFQSCLSKWNLNFIALNIFTEKVYGCYRNSLHGGRDMRHFSGLYFILRIIPCLIKLIVRPFSIHHATIYWYYSGTVFFSIALIVGITKPYKRAYMNYLDTLILSNLAVLYYSFVSRAHVLLLIRTLLTIPILVFITFMIIKTITTCLGGRSLSQCTCLKFVMRKIISLKTVTFFSKEHQFTIDSPTAAQPLIQPTSIALNYGSCDSMIISEDQQKLS